MQKPGLFGMNGFLLFLLTCCSFALQAQQTGSLILIDADNKLPFTVRIGDQLFASSGHGHLVIPHLKDSSYKLGVSFPKKTSGRTGVSHSGKAERPGLSATGQRQFLGVVQLANQNNHSSG